MTGGTPILGNHQLNRTKLFLLYTWSTELLQVLYRCSTTLLCWEFRFNTQCRTATHYKHVSALCKTHVTAKIVEDQLIESVFCQRCARSTIKRYDPLENDNERNHRKTIRRLLKATSQNALGHLFHFISL